MEVAPTASKQVWYGIEYTVDLQSVRQRMVEREPVAAPMSEEGEVRGLKGHSDRAGVSHMTFRRLLAGERVQLATFHRILRYLDLQFGVVARTPAVQWRPEQVAV